MMFTWDEIRFQPQNLQLQVYPQKQLTFQAHTSQYMQMYFTYMYVFMYIYMVYIDDVSNSALVCFATSSMRSKNLPNSSGQLTIFKLNLTIFLWEVFPPTHQKVGLHSITRSYHIISYHIVSYHIISYHIISYHIISYHIISYYVSLHNNHVYIYIIYHKYIYIYHISIEVSFLSQKKSPRNATEAILHQSCWWGGPGAIVTGVAADALLHILIRWNGWNPIKLEVGYRRFHMIYLYMYMYYIAESFISMLQKVNNLEFRPLFLDVFTRCRFSMSEMFSWNIPMKTRQQAKVWHVFLDSWQTSILVLPVSTFFWKKSEKHTGEPKVSGGVTAPPATL